MQASDAAGTAFERGPRPHLVNRAQNLRAYFDERGVLIGPREWNGWRFRLSLEGLARGDWRTAEPAPGAAVEGDQVVYDHGWGREIYRNSQEGIEQLFEIRSRPAAADAPLEIRLRGEGLRVGAEGGGRIVFAAETRDVLSYGKLVVRDAAGRDIPSRIERRDGGEIALVIEDAAAEYPVLVDPVLSSPSWTLTGSQNWQNLGYSAATAGDVNGDGYSDIIVGAHGTDTGATDGGRAYLFYGSPTGPSPTPLILETNFYSCQFGVSVATAGDVNGDGFSDVIIGGYAYDGSYTDEGIVFIYHGSAAGLQEPAARTITGGRANSYLGLKVATAGDVNGDGYSDVIISASHYDNDLTDEGRVYVYHGSPSGISGSYAWMIEGDQAYSYLGHYGVSTAGDVNGDGYDDVIVGHSHLDIGGAVDAGRAYVYYGSAAGLETTPAWTTEKNQYQGYYGLGVGTAGDVNGDGYADVIVAASHYDNPEPEEGKVFVYYGSAAGLRAVEDWTYEGNQSGAYFGYLDLGTAGDVNGDGYSDIIVGSHGYTNGQTREGRAFVFHGSPTGLSSAPDWTAESDQSQAVFGHSAAATAGDVNGDGFSDVIVGAFAFDYGGTDQGRAYLFYGSPNGTLTAGPVIETNQDASRLGTTVSTAGDVNGDGFDDMVVGAPYFDNGQADEGRAFVFLGTASGPAAAPSATFEINQADARFGGSVASAGDVNGDGFADVIVGASGYDGGETDEGAAFVYLGGSSLMGGAPAWTAEGNQAGANFGVSVAPAGDVDGDGFADVIIGANLYDGGETNEGRAFVYLGSKSGPAAGAAWTAESDQAGAQFGFSVATAGDVNRDGYSEVIVGAPYFDNGQTDEGRAFVYHGSASGLTTTADWTTESDQADAHYGSSVATAGDVNRDGFSDVVAGAPDYDEGLSNRGKAWLFSGSSSGLSTSMLPGVVNGDFETGDFTGWTETIDVGDPYVQSADAKQGTFAMQMDAAPGDWEVWHYPGIWQNVYVPTAGNPQLHFWHKRWTTKYWGGHFAGLKVNGEGIYGIPISDWQEATVDLSAYLGQTVKIEFGMNVKNADNQISMRIDDVYLIVDGVRVSGGWGVKGSVAGARFGASVASAGDVNGDGCSDVIVGAPGDTNNENGEGRAYLYRGGTGGLSVSAGWIGEPDQIDAAFGSSVSKAGDVNGDGYSDLIMGAPGYDNGQTDEGAAFVYFGNAAGIPVRPRQLQANDMPIQPLGVAKTDVKMALFGRTPMGRTRARLQIECKPIGSLFDGTGLVNSPYADLGTNGAKLEQTILGLVLGAYHWRARLQYYPYLSYGQWFSSGANGREEADFRIRYYPKISGFYPPDSAWITTTTPTLSAFVEAPQSGHSVRAEFSVSAWPYEVGTSVTTSGTSTTVTTPLSQGTQTWVARAYNETSGLYSDASTPLTFRIDSIGPTLGVPAVSPNPSRTGDVRVSWIAWDDMSGLDGIVVERSDNGGAFADVATLAGTAVEWIQSPAAGDGNYVYRLRATDVAGNVSTSGESLTVRVDSSKPSAPSLVSPSDDAVLQASQIALDWSEVSGVTGGTYDVQVSATPAFGTIAWSANGLGVTQATTGALGIGTYYWRARVVDGATAGSWSLPWSFTSYMGVAGGNLTPGTVGAAYAAAVAVSGGKAPMRYEVTAGSLPPGVILSPATGEISGTPTAPGRYTFTVTVTDSSDPRLAISQTMTIEVTGTISALAIVTTSPLPAAWQGLPYACFLNAGGGYQPYAWTVTSGALPPGVMLSSETGLLYGSPSAGGNYVFAVQVRDSDTPAKTASRTFSVTVSAPVGSSMTKFYPSQESALVKRSGMVAGTPYAATFDAPGATSWAIAGGSLPPGLTLDLSTGRISGTPTTIGMWRFVVKATDATGAAAYLAVEMSVIANAAGSMRILAVDPPAGRPGEFYSWTPTATGGTVPFTWSIPSDELPPGLGLDASTGEISGTPTSAGTWSVTLQAKDSNGSSSLEVEFRVGDDGPVPMGGGRSSRCGLLGAEALLLLALFACRRRG